MANLNFGAGFTGGTMSGAPGTYGRHGVDPMLTEWSKDWRRLRMQKHRRRGGVEARMLLDLCMYHGEHSATHVQNAILARAFRNEKDKNKLRLVFNFIMRHCDRKIGRLWGIDHRYYATPNVNDPVAFDKADVLSDGLIPALDFKLQQKTLAWTIYYWTVICGVCVEHVDYKDGVTREVLPKYIEGTNEIAWKDKVTGVEMNEAQVQSLLSQGASPERFEVANEVRTTGDVGGDVYDPFRVFIDASVPMIKKLGPDQRLHFSDIRTIGWVRENFGDDVARQCKPMKDVSIIETQLNDRGIPLAGMNLKDLLPLVQGSHGEGDPELVIVNTAYQPPHRDNPYGIRMFYIPDQCILHQDPIPYPEVPGVDYHWGAPAQTFWTNSFVTNMIAAQKFVNKRMSQMGEAANAQIYEMLLLGGGLSAKDIPTDFPGVVRGGISEDGRKLVDVVPRGNLPSFFPDSIRMSMEFLDMLGSADLMSQRKFPGQLRGPLAIPLLQEIMDSEDGPRYSHLAEQFGLEKLMRVNRVKDFYPPVRTLQYLGANNRNEVLEFHNDETLRAGVDFTVTVDPGTIVPESSAMREAKVRERMQWAPGLYTNKRTGQLDWTKVARDLKYTDRERESLEGQARKLARKFIQRARNGQLVAQQAPQPAMPAAPPQGEMVGGGPLQQTPMPQSQQPGPPKVQIFDIQRGAPLVVLPFWDHDAMMDEYEAEMTTDEWNDADPSYQAVLLGLHDMHRAILASLQQAQANSVNSQMQQNAVAQATQQAAAQVASTTVDAVAEQIFEQGREAGRGGMQQQFGDLEQRVRALIGDGQAEGGQALVGQRQMTQMPSFTE